MSSLNIVPPSVSVQGVTLRDTSARGFTMAFDIDLKNDNAFPLPLTTMDYQLWLMTTSLASGKIEPGGSLPAQGTRRLVVPLAISFEGLLAAAQTLKNPGADIPYIFAGGFSVDTGMPLVGQLRAPFSYPGILKLREFLNDPVLLLKSGVVRQLAEGLLRSAVGQ